MRCACIGWPKPLPPRALPTVATGDVLYHAPQRRMLQDVLTCIREGCTIDELGFRRERFADRHLRPPEEMARLFARHPDAVARTLEIVDRCPFDLRELRYQYPAEIEDPALTPQQTLEKLTWEGAARRYPDGVPDDVAAQLRHELSLIAELGIRPVFSHREQHRSLRAHRRTSCARDAVRPPTRPCATCSASPASIPSAAACCSSGSSRPSGANRPTSMSISSTSGARK